MTKSKVKSCPNWGCNGKTALTGVIKETEGPRLRLCLEHAFLSKHLEDVRQMKWYTQYLSDKSFCIWQIQQERNRTGYGFYPLHHDTYDSKRV